MRRRTFIAANLLPLLVTQKRGIAAPAPVVLELFTSQGCSSCPPADALLGELANTPGIIGLAWHVDYWNNLGWRDRFARPEWTRRQREYARQLNDEVYTPALVVNGSAMVVGSDKAAVRLAIDQASPSLVYVALHRTAAGLEAEIDATATPVTGLLVTYDPEQATRVDAGENRGNRLVEYRVVREVVTLDRLTPRPTILTVPLPPVPEGRGAVLLVQDAKLRVIGAADLPPGVPR
jgi:hypothetical protein